MATILPIPTTGARGRGVSSPGNVDTQFDVLTDSNLTLLGDAISTDIATAAGAGTAGWLATAFNVGGSILDTLAGNDALSATGAGANATGILISTGKLETGLGNDRLNFLLTGAGSVGLSNVEGTYSTGDGIDVSTFDADLHGVVNGDLNAPGNNKAQIVTGGGADKIVASSVSGHAVINYGTINMGADTENDKDVLSGSSGGHLAVPVPAYTPGKFGIVNTGTISMGGGKDVVDALTGGFSGGGLYNLGWTKTVAGVTTQDSDADAVMGFGAGTFIGGGGRNSITLPDGNYTVSYATVPASGILPQVTGHSPTSVKDFASGSLTRNGAPDQMVFSQFDGVGGNAPLGALHFGNVAPGGVAVQALQSFTVLADGNVTNIVYA